MKRICILPLMGPDEYLPFVIDSVIDAVDCLLFSVSERSWGNANIRLTPENKEWIQDFVKTNPKFQLMLGDWGKENDQHNDGIEYARKNGYGLVLCAATDQVYGEGEANKILTTLENAPSGYDHIRAQSLLFWKKKPLYVIEPPDPYRPIVAFRVREGLDYYDVSEMRGNSISFESSEVKFYHFAYARDDAFILNKIRMSSHTNMVDPSWYAEKWLNFKPGDENLSPFWPSNFRKAVPFPLEQLPPKLRDFFK